jgi:hypothetical protein
LRQSWRKILSAALVAFGLCLPATTTAAQSVGIHVALRSNVDPYHNTYEQYASIWGDGNFAYVGSERNYGVLIYDITNPDAPVLASHYAPTVIDMEDVKVASGVGYFASNMGDGLHIVDVSDPYNPVFLSRINSANGGYDNTHKIAVWSNFVFIPQNLVAPANIQVFDVTNPSTPVFFKTIKAKDSKWVNDLTIQTASDGHTYMYTAGWGGLGEIYDVTNLATTGEVFLGSFSDGIDGSSVSATADGNFLAYSRKTTDGTSEVKIWDITNRASAVLKSTLKMSTLGIDAIAPHDPHIVGNLLYVSWFQAGTLIFDITNPASPVMVGSYDTYLTPPLPAQLEGNWGVYPYLGQDKVLLSDRETGLYVVDATGESAQPALYNLHLNPTTVVAQSASTGTVYLVGLPGAGGIAVTTASDNAAATTPASVTVAQNANSANFTVNTSLVNSITTADISAAYGGATDTAALTISPTADYSLAVGPSQITLFPSQNGTFNGTVTGFGGYTNTVTMSCTSGAPSTCNYSPNPVTPTSAGAAFTLTVGSSTAADYSFNVQGVGSDSNHLTHQSPVTVSVVDFSVGTPSPSAVSMFPGASSQFTVQVGASGSFSGQVDLSCDAPASGVTCSFSPSASVSPTKNSPVTVTVTVNSTSSTPAGQYTLTVSGNTGGAPAPKMQSVTLNVVDFSLGSASPGTVNVFPGASSQFSMQAGALGPFSGAVTLTCNAPASGVSCSFAPSSTVNPTSGNPVTVTVTVTSTSNTPTGQYTLTVSANSSGAPAPKTQNVSLGVSDFALGAASPGTITVVPGTSSPVTMQVTASGPFSGMVALSCNTPASGVTCSFAPSGTVSPTSASPVAVTVTVSTTANTAPGQYSLIISGNSSGAPAAKTQTVGLSVGDFSVSASTPTNTVKAGATATYPLTIAPLGGSFTSAISFSCSGLPSRSSCTFNPTTFTPGSSSGTVTLSIATTAAVVAGLHPWQGGSLFYASILPLFGIVLASRKKPRARLSGWGGACILALLLLTGCGGGSSGSNPQPTPGTPPGTYTVTVQATSGTLSHSTTVTLTVQ